MIKISDMIRSFDYFKNMNIKNKRSKRFNHSVSFQSEFINAHRSNVNFITPIIQNLIK